MRIALVGPAHPYKGGGARHTTELAHRLAAAGHNVIVESWRAQYPAWLYPGRQTLDAPEGRPYPRTYRRLAWNRPDGWAAEGRRLRSADLVVFALLTPLQVPAYLVILAGLGRGPARPRTVVICHNVLPHERRPGDVALIRALLSHVDTVLVHSAEQAAEGRRLRSADLVVFALLTPLQVSAYLAILAGLGRRPGRPRTVVICHNVLPHERRPGDVALVRTLLSHVDTVLVHSAGQAAEARQLVPDVPIVVARMPPHLPFAASEMPAAEHEDLSAERSAVPASGQATCNLLFFGIVRPYKGLDVLLRALAQAPEQVTLTVAGEFWGGTGETDRLIAALGLQDRVTLQPGYVPADQIPALFEAADALVLPYREATASQNVVLAFSYGVPVIATTAGALAEAVRDGVDGLTCAPGDVDDLARALTAISVPETAASLRSGVRAVDPEPYWAAYLKALLAG